jgi:hypothetical protein
MWPHLTPALAHIPTAAVPRAATATPAPSSCETRHVPPQAQHRGYRTTASCRRHHAPERGMHGSSSAFQVARPPVTPVPCGSNAGTRQHMSDAPAERAAMPLSSAKQTGATARASQSTAGGRAGARPQRSMEVGRSPVVHAVGSARAGNAGRRRLG